MLLTIKGGLKRRVPYNRRNKVYGIYSNATYQTIKAMIEKCENHCLFFY